jgi:ribonuclease HI
MIRAYFDGACGPKNDGTGDMGLGIVVYRDEKKVFEKAVYVPYTAKYEKLQYGKTTFTYKDTSNNLAEHLALFHLLKFLFVETDYNKREEIQIYGDSLMVVNQMSGEWRINSDKIFFDAATKNKHVLDTYLYWANCRWIPREKNHVADELSKLGCVNKLTFEKRL